MRTVAEKTAIVTKKRGGFGHATAINQRKKDRSDEGRKASK